LPGYFVACGDRYWEPIFSRRDGETGGNWWVYLGAQWIMRLVKNQSVNLARCSRWKPRRGNLQGRRKYRDYFVGTSGPKDKKGLGLPGAKRMGVNLSLTIHHEKSEHSRGNGAFAAASHHVQARGKRLGVFVFDPVANNSCFILSPNSCRRKPREKGGLRFLTEASNSDHSHNLTLSAANEI